MGLSVREVHIKIADSSSTDSCILAFRKFISRYGEPQLIVGHKGPNMKAADKELWEALMKVDKASMKNEMVARKATWNFNPPARSHMEHRRR